MVEQIGKKKEEKKNELTDEDKDFIRGQLYDVGINLKVVENAVYYVASSYKFIDLSKAQELIKKLKEELGLE
jgi:hypothetical protein